MSKYRWKRDLQDIGKFGIAFACKNKRMRKLGGDMKKRKSLSLGDLIAALFEESKKVTTDRLEQNLLVYAALRDLLRKRVHSVRPIAIRA